MADFWRSFVIFYAIFMGSFWLISWTIHVILGSFWGQKFFSFNILFGFVPEIISSSLKGLVRIMSGLWDWFCNEVSVVLRLIFHHFLQLFFRHFRELFYVRLHTHIYFFCLHALLVLFYLHKYFILLFTRPFGPLFIDLGPQEEYNF